MRDQDLRNVVGQLSRWDFLRVMGAGTVAIAAGGLTSCGGEGGGSAGPLQFTTWYQVQNPPDPPTEAVKSILNKYEKDTKAKIDVTGYPYNEYLDQLLLQLRGGENTGVVHLDINWLPSLVALGGLADLGSVASEVDYTDAALRTGELEGVQYGLPWTTASIGMAANSALLEEAGVSELPKTIEEFEAALEALKDLEGVTPYAAMTDVSQLKDIIPWMWTYGSDVVSEGRITLGDEGSVRAVEWFKSLLDRGYIAPGVNRDDARALFGQGKVGFYDDASLAREITAALSSNSDFASQVVPVPRPTLGSGDPQAALWGHILLVFEGDNAESGTELARYLTSNTESVIELFEVGALPPTTTKALNSKVVTRDEYVTTWTGEITKYARISPFAEYAEYARMESILAEQVQAVLADKASAQEAMDEAKEEISDLTS